MSLFTFEELSKNEEKLVISFSKFLPTFYIVFSFFGQVNKYLIIPVLIFYNSTGYYKGCDIAWDIILRYIDVYFTKFNLIAFLIFLAVIVLATIVDAFVYSFYDWILSKTKIDSLSSFIGFIKFILNYLNFLSYITILFYIGFAIQNIVRMNSVTNNYKESRNFDLWRLGKIFKYYIQEVYCVEEGHKEVKETFEKFESDHPFDPQLAQLKIKYKNFDEKISSIGNKVIYALLDEVEKATEENLERVIKENVEKKENEGNNIEIKENNDNNKDNNENNENKNNKDDKDNKKGHEIIVTNFCCCCCNCNKDKNIVNENNKKEKKIEDKNEEYRKKKEECKEDVAAVKNKIEKDQKKYKKEKKNSMNLKTIYVIK